jgi:16S rRNA (uracil1498-N3)-methyltransferase
VRRLRFFLPGATSGALLHLPKAASHHARSVLRMRIGESLVVFDGRGNEFEALVDATDRRQIRVRILTSVDAIRESSLRLIVALPPLKHDLMSLVVQKCTELGVNEIWPVTTSRADVEGRSAIHGARYERWSRIAISASEQCGRSVVPEIRPVINLVDLLTLPFEGARILCCAWGVPLSDCMPITSPTEVILLVGPAGGLTDDESERAVESGFLPVTLGPRLLRAETAVIAAVTLCQSAWGDLRTARP